MFLRPIFTNTKQVVSMLQPQLKQTKMKPEIYIGDKSRTAALLFKAMVAGWPHETEIISENNAVIIATKTWTTASFLIIASSKCEMWEAADCMEAIKPTEIIDGYQTHKIGWDFMAPDDLLQAVKENSEKFCEMLSYWEFEVITL